MSQYDGAGDWGSGGGGIAVASAWNISDNVPADTGYEGGTVSFDKAKANDNGHGDADGGAGGGDRACFNCGETGYVTAYTQHVELDIKLTLLLQTQQG